MYRRFKKLDNWTRIGLVIWVAFLLGFSIIIGFQLTQNKSAAFGGGIQQLVGVSTASSNTVTITISASGNGKVVIGNFLFVDFASNTANVKINSITGGSLSWSLEDQIQAQGDHELWVANKTSASSTVTITVNLNATVASVADGIAVSGLTSLTPTAQGNVSFTTTNPVKLTSNITPNLNDFCLDDIFENGAAATPTSMGTPFNQNHLQAQASTVSVDLLNADIMNGTATSGITQFSTAKTGSIIVSCYPTGPATTTATTTTTTSTTTSTTSTFTAYNYVERQNKTAFANSPTTSFLLTSTIPVIKNNLLVVTARNIAPALNDTFTISDNMSDTWIKKNGAFSLAANYPDIVVFIANASQSKVVKINLTATVNTIRISGFFHEFNLQEPFLSKSINTTATGTFIEVPQISTNYSNFVYSFAYGQNISNGASEVLTSYPSSVVPSYNQSALTQANYRFAQADSYLYGNKTGNYKYTWSSSSKASEIVLVFRLQSTVTSTTSTGTTTTTTTTSTIPTTTTSTSLLTTSTTTTNTSFITTATTSTSTNTITSTTTNQLIPENGDFALIGFIGLMAILFSILTFWMPSYGHYQIETKDLDYKTDLESMFGVGRIFTKIRLVLFPGMAAGMWFILAVLAIVLLPQDSTGAGGSLDLAGGLLFSLLGVAFIIITALAAISLWAVHVRAIAQGL